jgi:predicted acyl esterase
MFHGGVLSVGFLNWWHTNTRALTLLDPAERLTVAAPQNQAAFDFIAQVLRHPSYDEFWRERTPVDRLADIDIPVYSIANWNQAGLHLRANLYGYEQVRGLRSCSSMAGLSATPTHQSTSSTIRASTSTSWAGSTSGSRESTPEYSTSPGQFDRR